MPTSYTTFPITGKKTSEFDVQTSLPSTAFLTFWSGVTGDNLDRIALTDFINEVAKFFTSASETLTADKTIGSSDTFVQILDSGSATRTISVDNDISCFVHNTSGSANNITVEGTALQPGESCFVFWDGSSSHTVIKLAASGGGGSSFLEITETDLTDSSYYYYGGVDANSDWVINRYDKSNLSTRTVATESNNATYSSLSTAWSNRTTLTYA